MKTIRELRKYLFDNDISCFIDGELKTNNEARRILFDMPNQELKVIYTFRKGALELRPTINEIIKFG